MRLAIAIQVATGNLGRLGGSSGAQNWGGLPQPHVGRLQVPPNPASTEIPANDWADAVLRGSAGGYPEIHAALNVGGNYVCQGADVAKSVRAMQSLDFSVCHDLFLTATARQCDVVLPVTHWLERNDIVFTLANYLLFSRKVAEPQGEARNDYDILADVAEIDGLRGRVHRRQRRGRLAEGVRGGLGDPRRRGVPAHRHPLRRGSASASGSRRSLPTRSHTR